MSERKTIRQAIQRRFPAIKRDDSLETAINKMTKGNVSVLAVLAEGELIGLVTISDIMFRLTNENNPKDTIVSTLMTTCGSHTARGTRNPCLQLDEDEDALSAIKVMYGTGVNHLLVTGTNGKAVGIVSSLEIVKLFNTSTI